MKKLFLSLVAAGMLLAACNGTGSGSKADSSATAQADSSAKAANAPVVKFEKESHDFGKITEGDTTHYDFKFTNTGKSPLIITNARATCGCTTPTWPKSPVKPGESAVIGVTFNSAGKSGLQDKQITVTANTIPAETMVHLIGEVLKKK
ncbi:uncharacterized protein DUF1573 [Mucilaginibacter oryzae]|uniref:Uncharacterized protein DUF1573 n=1 Tax=Mucilaginibacter oryzae TaxID=468058 RepID=A0A316HBL2_9SPHI|nr:DUF1573 domain-containing protein [Mucilaginibacter oryzae]PWK77906.1 uncharacterized protein DUF1573 [Mucilaginibacter oryzae]